MEPHTSNHGVPLVYFSEKRENVLVYLSNAVEKYCKETGFTHDGAYQKWGPYGFNKDGRQRLEEYDAERGVFVLKYERYDAERDVREWESEELPLAMESFEWLVYDPED